MRENASRKYFNGSRPPFGFQRVPVNDGGRTRYRLELEDGEAVSIQTVRRIFALALEGVGCKQIAMDLNTEGFRTSTNRRWGAVTVHKVLTNEAHKGTLLWGGCAGHLASHSGEEPVRADNTWVAIVDKETFDQVQKSLAPRVTHPRTVSSRYLLADSCSVDAAAP
ncbi:MAG: recombinase family protein [SAR202 cluster bacterium]|jgi:hypothetical protein|nr:recombinase family protein [SAR202 cluster bacterium]